MPPDSCFWYYCVLVSVLLLSQLLVWKSAPVNFPEGIASNAIHLNLLMWYTHSLGAHSFHVLYTENYIYTVVACIICSKMKTIVVVEKISCKRELFSILTRDCANLYM